MISDELREQIRALSPIEQVVSENGVSLRRSGTQFFGRCPFHDERTPSFVVRAEKGLFFCHGCGVGGDVFRFVELQLRCDFKNAVAHLANRAGVTLEGFKADPELRARAAKAKAERAEQDAFERFCADCIDAISRWQHRLGCQATRAEQALRLGNLTSDEHERAWHALERYRTFEARVEREALLDIGVLREKWEAARGERHAA